MNEVLLMDVDGSILEGMSSNFGVIQNGSLVTPQEGVLLGSVRELVLTVCKNEGVETVLSAPNVSQADSWEGAFISSTSRLLLPIDEIRIQTPTVSLVTCSSSTHWVYFFFLQSSYKNA